MVAVDRLDCENDLLTMLSSQCQQAETQRCPHIKAVLGLCVAVNKKKQRHYTQLGGQCGKPCSCTQFINAIFYTASHVRIHIRYYMSRVLRLNVQWNRTFVWWSHCTKLYRKNVTLEYHAAGVSNGELVVFLCAYLREGWARLPADLAARCSAKCLCSC